MLDVSQQQKARLIFIIKRIGVCVCSQVFQPSTRDYHCDFSFTDYCMLLSLEKVLPTNSRLPLLPPFPFLVTFREVGVLCLPSIGLGRFRHSTTTSSKASLIFIVQMYQWYHIDISFTHCCCESTSHEFGTFAYCVSVKLSFSVTTFSEVGVLGISSISPRWIKHFTKYVRLNFHMNVVSQLDPLSPRTHGLYHPIWLITGSIFHYHFLLDVTSAPCSTVVRAHWSGFWTDHSFANIWTSPSVCLFS